jgi:hypothetical protein
MHKTPNGGQIVKSAECRSGCVLCAWPIGTREQHHRCIIKCDLTSNVGLSEAETKILDLDRSKLVKIFNV